jgi:hypothetical protein
MVTIEPLFKNFKNYQFINWHLLHLFLNVEETVKFFSEQISDAFLSIVYFFFFFF